MFCEARVWLIYFCVLDFMEIAEFGNFLKCCQLCIVRLGVCVCVCVVLREPEFNSVSNLTRYKSILFIFTLSNRNILLANDVR